MTKRGFTLIETLVVIVIMGLLSATVVLTWPAGGALREDASVLAARATLAAQESVLTGAAMGLDVTAAGYTFYRMKDGAWREVDDERAFRRQVWREGVVPQLRRDGFGTADRRSAKTTVTPTVIFDPSGFVPQFSLTLAEEGVSYVVAANDRGAVEAREVRGE